MNCEDCHHLTIVGFHDTSPWSLQGNRKRGRPRNTCPRDTEAEMLDSGHSWEELDKTAQSPVCWQIVVHGLCFSWAKGLSMRVMVQL